MRKHYFIGIKVPSLFESYVEQIRKKYNLHAAYKSIPHIEDLHITLLYVGPLAEDKVPLLTDKLSTIAASHSTFTLSVDGVSCFGSNSTPRVIYMSIENHSGLARLQKDIASEVEKLISQPNEKRFTPHITIAKKWKGTGGFQFEKEKRTPIEFPINDFSLFVIHPKEKPMYEAVHSFDLR